MRLFPAILVALLIAASSSTVIGPKAFVGGASRAVGVPRESFQSFWDATWWIFVKGFHAFEFALLALLLRRGGLGFRGAWLAALAWAVLDEWHQSFVPARGGRWTDVVVDAGGATAALAGAWLMERRHRRDGG